MTGLGAGMQLMMRHDGGFWLGRGSRMTLYQTIQEASCVFFLLQNARHHVAAGQFPDRHWGAWRDPAGHALGASWPPAVDRICRAAGDMRIFATGEFAALSARTPISTLGRG